VYAAWRQTGAGNGRLAGDGLTVPAVDGVGRVPPWPAIIDTSALEGAREFVKALHSALRKSLAGAAAKAGAEGEAAPVEVLEPAPVPEAAAPVAVGGRLRQAVEMGRALVQPLWARVRHAVPRARRPLLPVLGVLLLLILVQVHQTLHLTRLTQRTQQHHQQLLQLFPHALQEGPAAEPYVGR